MGIWCSRFRSSNFIIRLFNWEYWPFGVIQFPLFFYYPWLALRARSLTFFSGSNPGITMGGMFGESKYEVLKKIPAEFLPITIFIRQPTTLHEIMVRIRSSDLHFPLIFKPDIGERGFMVKRIQSESEIMKYLENMRYDFLIQELVDYPVEAGIFYRRLPKEEFGEVTSVVLKEMLSLEGDGSTPFEKLLLKKDRAKLQWKTLREVYQDRFHEIIPAGKKIEIVSIGNHCLGTKFINGNHLITPALSGIFDSVSKKIDGFYFGRYDLRCKSIADLREGRFKVLELNGCGAEPAHIYDPDFSLVKAIKILIIHWKTIFEIAMQNQKRGFKFLPLKEALNHYRTFKKKIR